MDLCILGQLLQTAPYNIESLAAHFFYLHDVSRALRDVVYISALFLSMADHISSYEYSKYIYLLFHQLVNI